jgi:hypothetical protein
MNIYLHFPVSIPLKGINDLGAVSPRQAQSLLTRHLSAPIRNQSWGPSCPPRTPKPTAPNCRTCPSLTRWKPPPGPTDGSIPRHQRPMGSRVCVNGEASCRWIDSSGTPPPRPKRPSGNSGRSAAPPVPPKTAGWDACRCARDRVPCESRDAVATRRSRQPRAGRMPIGWR